MKVSKTTEVMKKKILKTSMNVTGMNLSCCGRLDGALWRDVGLCSNSTVYMVGLYTWGTGGMWGYVVIPPYTWYSLHGIYVALITGWG